MARLRRWLVWGLVVGAVGLLLLFLPGRDFSALPYYWQTYIGRLRPTAILPTAPPISATEQVALLQIRPTFTPTWPPPTPTQLPAGTATAPPTASPTITPSPAPNLVTPPAPQISLTGFSHAWQTWNNCGPATIAMTLSYYQTNISQAEAAQFLKPNSNDKNVNPEELAAYARTLGFEAVVRLNGSLGLLQTLLSNGFPVIVESWLEPEDRGGLGHYRLLVGYEGGQFIAYDALHGPDLWLDMAEFDGLWRVFHRKYVVVSRPEQQQQLWQLLGNEADNLAQALATAQAEAQAVNDSYAWFNVGVSYQALGETSLAAAAFDTARQIGLPYRMLWYQFEPFAAYLGSGRYQEVIELATPILQDIGGLEELYYYRALAFRALGQESQAQADLRAALDYNPHFAPAGAALEQP